MSLMGNVIKIKHPTGPLPFSCGIDRLFFGLDTQPTPEIATRHYVALFLVNFSSNVKGCHFLVNLSQVS
jgi:hypothetical protein